MNKTLFVLTGGYDYENDDVLGVYETEALARLAGEDAVKLNLHHYDHYDVTPAGLGVAPKRNDRINVA